MKAPENLSPFKFLDAYQREDGAYFHGRTQETNELYDRVTGSKLTVFYGPSGTGKTSLIQCGLANRFATTDWYEVYIRRGDNINRSLRREIIANFPREVIAKEKAELEKMVLKKLIKRLYLQYYVPIYFIFDQFEELFVLGKEEEINTFFSSLESLLELSLHLQIILVIREDYFGRLTYFEKTIPSLIRNRQRLEPMSMLNLLEVIQKTTAHFDIGLEEGVAEKIINNLKDTKGQIELTYLQVYLDRLYRKELSRKNGASDQLLFDHKLLRGLGQLGKVLDVFLLEQLERVDEEIGVSGFSIQLLFTLVSREGTRRALDIDSIIDLLPQNEDYNEKNIAYCLKRFESLRILKKISTDESAN